MKSPLLAPLGAVLLLGLAGCSASHRTAWPEPRPLGDTYPAYRPPTAPTLEQQPEDPQPLQDLTLNDALSRALLYNPNLRVFGWEVRAREARTLQASRRPNPELEAETEELGVSLSQVLPFGGDVKTRQQVAARERDLAGWDYEATRLDVFTATAQHFATVLAAQERLRLADNLLGLARRFEQTVRDRAEAGKVSPLETTRAGVVRANAEIAHEQATRELRSARTQLSSLWSKPEPDFERVEGDFDEVRPVPALQIITDLIQRNPDVARFATERALRQAQVSQARAEGIPDPVLRAGPGRLRETGETTFRVGFSISLPLFDRNRGAIQEARYRLRQVDAHSEAARVTVQQQLASAYEILAAAHDEVTVLQDAILPAANETFEATEEGYREGKFDLLTLLDAQRTFFEASNRYVDALQTYHQARAEVERLIGTPLDALDS